MRNLPITLLSTLVLVLFTGCGSPEPETQEATEEATEASVTYYEGVGVLKTIDSTRVVINHEAIEGYMMAMTMPFTIRDEALLEGFSAEDSVSFTVTVDSQSLSYISALTRIE